MEINIKPEEIDLYVKNAIIESSIGKILKESSEKWINELCQNRYDSPIKRMISHIVEDMIKEEINKPENIERVRQAFVAKINAETIDEVIYKLMDKIKIESTYK